MAADLQQVVGSCLHKKREGRPADAATLSEQLAACEDAGAWTADDARRWWDGRPPVEHGADPERTTIVEEQPRRTVAIDWTLRMDDVPGDREP